MSTNFFQILENGNDSTSLYINDNKVLNKIVGVEDSFLKILEDLSGTQINLRGNLITIKGENSKSKNVINAINQMLKKTDKKVLEEEDVKSIYYFESEKTIETSDDVIIKTPKKNIFARTEKQKKYIKNLQASNIVFSLGPAGTGKTFLAIEKAKSLNQDNNVLFLTFNKGVANFVKNQLKGFENISIFTFFQFCHFSNNNFRWGLSAKNILRQHPHENNPHENNPTENNPTTWTYNFVIKVPRSLGNIFAQSDCPPEENQELYNSSN